MALREIVTVPEAVLRRKARPVAKFDEALQTLVNDMVETMRAAPGVGLAAPQVGVSEQVIVVEYPLNDEGEEAKPKLFVVVNPQIVRASPEMVNGIEGCLSVPELVGEVERAVEITVKGQNRRGQPIRIKARGWLARIFQHEIDHLNGVLFTDRASRVWKPENAVEDNV